MKNATAEILQENFLEKNLTEKAMDTFLFNEQHNLCDTSPEIEAEMEMIKMQMILEHELCLLKK